MALSGIQIYKMLPQTNCKECGFPTCLAFAMKLAAKQVELSLCPYVSDTSKAQLAESAAPPMRLVTLRADGHEIKVGNEVVLFRHEKTFYNKPGLFVRVRDDETVDAIKAKIAQADQFAVTYVGIDLTLDGFAIEAVKNDPAIFADAIRAVREVTKRPVILISRDAKIMAAGLLAIDGESPLIYAADENNFEAMAELAKQHKAPLAVVAESIDRLAEITVKIKEKGVEDLVIDPAARDLQSSLVLHTQIRRLALKKNFHAVGYPTITCPGESAIESVAATQAITKYAGF